jgi:RNA polymerase sigma factor (sigma-70 family)
MSTATTGLVIRRLRDLVATGPAGQASDHELLHRFLTDREERAFEALVKRHGPLVLGVCRRVLGNLHDAEDAFQATFLTLARRAESVGKEGSVGGWLYQVAYHMATKAKAQATARQKRERLTQPRPPTDPLTEVTGRELLAVLDEELQRLPETYRTPLVHCYLEGRTRDEAAGLLGWSLSTLQRRLEQGRERLRGRLARRGLALPAALLATGLAQGAAAAVVPPVLAASTVKAVVLGPVGVVSARAAALAQEAVKGLAGGKLKAMAAVLLAVSVVVSGIGAIAHRALAAKPEQKAAADQLRGLVPPVPEKLAPRPIAFPDQAKPVAGEQQMLSGQVHGPDGKPVPEAEVALVVPAKEAGNGPVLQAKARTDREGRFRLKGLPAAAAQGLVIASAEGFGPGWQALPTDPKKPEVTIRLAQPQTVRVRLIDLQG